MLIKTLSVEEERGWKPKVCEKARKVEFEFKEEKGQNSKESKQCRVFGDYKSIPFEFESYILRLEGGHASGREGLNKCVLKRQRGYFDLVWTCGTAKA
ncbi:uncharacterized protein E5676_scaffold228G00400 [Cucumis melo var. makuwa]|uniref:Uncharacterized protein n=1 Tax=Cucumis melo var. makuwa TaxID=1194695 RepID=A0A5D3D9U9_CUCMM|nr:uncharacterized protein E6C27_scaffold125G002110 [Cucumis melo var. makuwa]TYK20346.1 uncharacterized protein E5676_scaffold228G00400 [Cucumis melo var. makuwa]